MQAMLMDKIRQADQDKGGHSPRKMKSRCPASIEEYDEDSSDASSAASPPPSPKKDHKYKNDWSVPGGVHNAQDGDAPAVAEDQFEQEL
jgi:hypothetical protein